MTLPPDPFRSPAAPPVDTASRDRPDPLPLLARLREAERPLRQKTVSALVPVLPKSTAGAVQQASQFADRSLQELAGIDLEQISDRDLYPARILVGLTFVGGGALTVLFLLLYLTTLHPELSPVEQMQQYWYQYVWFVGLGVAGMFMLGREAMRGRIEANSDPTGDTEH